MLKRLTVVLLFALVMFLAKGMAQATQPDSAPKVRTYYAAADEVGQFAQAIVSHKIDHVQFAIETNAPNVEVSWQITAVRHDGYAKAHPLVVEEEKDARTKGFYIHPELYGASEEQQIEWARHAEMMKKLKQHRENPHAAHTKVPPKVSTVSGSAT